MIDALVLAAGTARRMGFDKRLAMLGGRPMLAHALAAALGSRARIVLLVTEPGFAPNPPLVPPNARLRHVAAPDAPEGLAASLRAGIAALPEDAAGALVCLGDMPLLTAAMLDRVLDGFVPDGIAAAARHGRRGHPVLWSRRFFPDLLALRGEAGGRAVLERHAASLRLVEAGSAAVRLDIDTPAQLRRLQGLRWPVSGFNQPFN